MDLILLLIIVVVHESFHYIYALLRGYKSKIRPTIFGLETTKSHVMPLYDDFLMTLVGVIVGLPLAIIWDMTIVYYVLCTFDVAKIIADIDIGLRYGWKVNDRDIAKMILKGVYRT